MHKLKVIYLTIMSMIFPLIFSFIIGLLSAYIFNDLYIGGAFFFIIFFLFYWNYVGPMRHATKRKVKELTDKDIFINMLINPFSEESEFYNKRKDEIFIGIGLIDRFTDLYVTMPSRKGIFFYNMNMPYLPIYLLPWKNIKNIIMDSDFVKENNINHVDDTLEVSLVNKEKILLPLSSETVDYWKSNHQGT